MMNVYFIPGLGADKKIFKNIKLPAGCSPHYLEWIKPEKDETLRSYAYRLAEEIDRSQPYVIVGLSFGGMLASEIISKDKSGRMILISSVSCSKHLPTYYHVAGTLRLHKLIPVSLMKSAALLKRLFTAETPEQKAYLRNNIRHVDIAFIRWALDAIIKWKSETRVKPAIHVQGSRDAILPVMFCKPTHIIKGGGHLMILTQADEINKIIADYLSAS